MPPGDLVIHRDYDYDYVSEALKVVWGALIKNAWKHQREFIVIRAKKGTPP